MLKSKIDSHYEQHNCERVSQGDILRNFYFYYFNENEAQIELTFVYTVVLSQDCDLEQGNKFYNENQSDGEIKEFNQFLPNVLIFPAFQVEELRSGAHLKDLFLIQTERLNSQKFNNVKNDEIPRYHFLPGFQPLQIPELILDFKTYYTVPFAWIKTMHSECYLSTINELFREKLSQRFVNYFCRIGTPEIKKCCWTDT